METHETDLQAMSSENNPSSSKDPSATWMERVRNGHMSLDRMIEEAFPDEESLFAKSNDRVDDKSSERRYSSDTPGDVPDGSKPLGPTNAETLGDGEPKQGEENSELGTASSEQRPIATSTSNVSSYCHMSLGRMIDEAFPDQESLYPEKNPDFSAAVESQRTVTNDDELERTEVWCQSEDGESESDEEFTCHGCVTDPSRPHTNEVGAAHPWGFIDYYKVMKHVEKNPLVHNGVILFAGNTYHELEYERAYDGPANYAGKRQRLLFAEIPLPDENNGFGTEVYLLYYDVKTEEIVVRCCNKGSDRLTVYDIRAVWNTGVDVYAFKVEELYDTICRSVDEKEGQVVFPELGGMRYCLDKQRNDHPGLQLVIMIQCAAFMAQLSRVLLGKTQDPELAKNREDMIKAVEQWRYILERGSFEMWMDYRSGVSKHAFVRKMCIKQAVTASLGLTHGKIHKQQGSDTGTSDSDDDWSESNDAAKRRERKLQNEAIRRAQSHFDRIFAEPTPEERAKWRSLVSIGKTEIDGRDEDEGIFAFSPVASTPIREEAEALGNLAILTYRRGESAGNVPPTFRAAKPTDKDIQESVDSEHESSELNQSEPAIEPGWKTERGNESDAETAVDAAVSTPSESRTETEDDPESSNGHDWDTYGYQADQDQGQTNTTDKSDDDFSDGKAADGKDEQDTGAEKDEDHWEEFDENWPKRPPITTLCALLDCLQEFVTRYPQMDTAMNRIRFRSMVASMGITMMEARDRPPWVTRHPFGRPDRGPQDSTEASRPCAAPTPDTRPTPIINF
ncbi:hypothetical protein VTO42DRAFT_5434 [Malbranchea cinnamomea]